MTKKDYELTATVFKKYVEANRNNDFGHFTQHIVSALANELEDNDPKFNRTKFLQTCGL